MVICALCGLVFDERTAAPACGTCPLATGCTLVACPNCGFHAAVHDRGADSAGTAASEPATTLADLSPGETAAVADLDPGLDLPRQRALVALGLLPGVRVRLVRRSPTLTVRTGARLLALDRTLASGVRITAGPANGRHD
jgi:Fe2+ transport system protein FeoA/rubredoxin